MVENGSRPTDAGLVRAIEAQTAALAVMKRAEPHMDTAYLAQSLADSFGGVGEEATDMQRVASHHLTLALALAPGQPRGWLVLAGSRYRAGDANAAAQALDVSFDTDPHAPLLAPFRWPLANALATLLSRDTRERANLEFLSFFRAQPEIAVRIALRSDRLAALAALADERGDDRDRLANVLESMEYGGTGT